VAPARLGRLDAAVGELFGGALAESLDVADQPLAIAQSADEEPEVEPVRRRIGVVVEPRAERGAAFVSEAVELLVGPPVLRNPPRACEPVPGEPVQDGVQLCLRRRPDVPDAYRSARAV
jgi:hypothetical protein